MNIAVLFDGAGLARLGLEQAGHTCTGFELDPAKHYLSKMVGSGNCVLADVRDVDLSRFDAIWASPPCQSRSMAKTLHYTPVSKFSDDMMPWTLATAEQYKDKIWWIENVTTFKRRDNAWGQRYNAAQFLSTPIQNRNRIIGGFYKSPAIWRTYKRKYQDWDLCPTITATEYQGHKNDTRRASRWYGRKLTPMECAWHQGFDIPLFWWPIPDMINPATNKSYTLSQWRKNIYMAIGNGVLVYMARAFGEAYTKPDKGIRQLSLI